MLITSEGEGVGWDLKLEPGGMENGSLRWGTQGANSGRDHYPLTPPPYDQVRIVEDLGITMMGSGVRSNPVRPACRILKHVKIESHENKKQGRTTHFRL